VKPLWIEVLEHPVVVVLVLGLAVPFLILAHL
jgi:hypothetical protein